jgi:hypothetical protein
VKFFTKLVTQRWCVVALTESKKYLQVSPEAGSGKKAFSCWHRCVVMATALLPSR